MAFYLLSSALESTIRSFARSKVIWHHLRSEECVSRSLPFYPILLLYLLFFLPFLLLLLLLLFPPLRDNNPSKWVFKPREPACYSIEKVMVCKSCREWAIIVKRFVPAWTSASIMSSNYRRFKWNLTLPPPCHFASSTFRDFHFIGGLIKDLRLSVNGNQCPFYLFESKNLEILEKNCRLK